jgi:hypothetical protein
VGGRCRSKTRYIIVRTHDWSRTNYYPLITSVSIHIKRLCRVYFVTDLSSNSSFHKTITQIVLIDRLKRLWDIMKYSIWLINILSTITIRSSLLIILNCMEIPFFFLKLIGCKTARIGQILHMRLRTACSSLNHHLFLKI